MEKNKEGTDNKASILMYISALINIYLYYFKTNIQIQYNKNYLIYFLLV